MADPRRTSHHSLNGDELRTIIEQRVKQGINQSMNLRAMFAYPLVRYKVTIEVIPYRHQGQNPPVEDTGKIDRCIVEGQEYVQVREETVELTHDSAIIGYEKDPQKEREEIGLGAIETRRVEGAFVDVHVGAKVTIEEPELPPLSGRPKISDIQPPSDTPSVMRPGEHQPIKPPLANRTPVDVPSGMKPADAPIAAQNPAGVDEAEAAKILSAEAEVWRSPAPDGAFNEAMKSDDPLPGRIQTIEKKRR